MTKLFVYGTLMRGCSNHGYLTGCEWKAPVSTLIGPCKTVEPYTFHLVHGAIPAISPGGGQQIVGELWSVPTGRMVDIRYLETGYVETVIAVECNGTVHDATAFVLPRSWADNDSRIAAINVDSFRKVVTRTCFA